MKTPNISPKHDYYHYWKPVETGEIQPDEWQQALIDLYQKALDLGLFYTRDIMEWAKKNNDFIPVEWWDFQFANPHTPVEGGIMGMELYSAWNTIRAKKEREENKKVLDTLSIGQSFGSLSVNSKRVNKCVIESIDGNQVVFTGVTGKYSCKFWTDAKNIPSMINQAIEKGWRKS